MVAFFFVWYLPATAQACMRSMMAPTTEASPTTNDRLPQLRREGTGGHARYAVVRLTPRKILTRALKLSFPNVLLF
ncbi:hypothetical protein EDB92DRAFT_1879887 [Lactarius akahatsu]|uniref:Secreted protein n=1 Tax=Lactarius akahatsu TaxID=416441 RepID=A0AAD4QB72_9AGAM|nr:hypothetical protein EDB92DRAFT_1879887 [Lactarius akahatsu]